MAEERESVGGGSDASVKRVCRRGSSSSVGSTTEAPLILILEMLGYLIAIDLNQHQRQDGCVPVPVLLRLDLPTSMYPVGMHHVKTKQGGVVKHYLLGGITDYGYSNKIYELKADLLLSIIARGDDVSHGVVLNEISTTLTGAKCPTSFDLGDTTYLLHRFQPYHTSGFGPDFPFERLDASSDQSWLVEKDPPFYQTWPTQDMDGRDVPMEIDGENLKKVKFESYFAVGDKLLIFCNDQSLQWFTPGIGDNNGEGAWDSSTDRYEHVSDSFSMYQTSVIDFLMENYGVMQSSESTEIEETLLSASYAV
ncbi:hypothetical protein RIF29_08382 [Crotalaria pallida]|uniref:Uncharacterized protein n=1 Tax=Crotalaria pallida TaxID=3830 RepID=A0AAN9FTL0_CROPI